MEHAFRGPEKVLSRFGTLDPAAIAAADPEEFTALCSRPPAIHRFPGSMAARLQAAGAHGRGRVRRRHRPALDRGDLRQGPAQAGAGAARFGKQKAQIFVALVAKQLGVRPEGWEEAAGDYALEGYRSVADVVGRGVAAEGPRVQAAEEGRGHAPKPERAADGSLKPSAGEHRPGGNARPHHRPWHQWSPAALDFTGPCRAPMSVDERCSCPRTHARCFLPRCCRTPPSSPWSSAERPTGSLTPEEVRQASEDAQVEPRHLKALLAHLSALGISVSVNATQQPRGRGRVAAQDRPPPRPRPRRPPPPAPRRPPPRRRAGQEGGRQEGAGEEGAATKAAADGRPSRSRCPRRRRRPRRQEDPARRPRRAVREGRQGRPDDRGGREVRDVRRLRRRRHRRARAAGHGRRRDRRPGQGLPQADRQGPAAQRRDGGRARQADRGRPLLRGEARQGRQDLARSSTRSSSGSPRTAAAPRTTCSRPTCASSSRWPSATPAAACSSST